MTTECQAGKTKADLKKNAGRMSRIFTTYKEQFEPLKALVTGVIPTWLKGDLVRAGPGMFEINGDKFNHFFDGMSILHKFSIHKGQVTYQSKFLRSDVFKTNMQNQRISVTEFGTTATPDPCKSLFQRFFATFNEEISDNCTVNILPFQNDEFYVATETPFLRKFDPKSLDTLEKIDLQQLVAVNLATAHPHFEEDGTMYNIGSSFDDGRPHFCVIKVPPADLDKNDGSPSAFSKATMMARIPGQFRVCPCYIHSFAMTENYIILMEQPLYINVLKLIFKHKVMRRPFSECFEFDDKRPTKIHVVEKSTGRVLLQKYTCPPQFVFHHINAYEDGGHIVMDVVDNGDGSLIKKLTLDFYIKQDGSPSSGTALRYVFPLSVPEGAKTGNNLVSLETTATAILNKDGSIHCQGETLCESGFELPTVNLKYNARKYRYFYACGVFNKGTFSNTVLKCDLQTKEVKTWKASDTAFPSEPIFVPAPDAAEEDDGVVLCGVTDVSPDVPDFLVLLDGKTLTEIGRASIPYNARIPYGLHGQFLY